MKILNVLICVVLVLAPAAASAWWNDEWNYRKEIVVDTSVTGGDIIETQNEVPVLLRLSLGNFAYFLETQPSGADFRFIASDDVTPLKFHIERYDPASEMAFIWVKVPTLQGGSNLQSFYMYYGNAEAVDAQDAAGSYDVNQVLVYHFAGGQAVDSTAFGNNPQISTAVAESASLIGDGMSFGVDEAGNAKSIVVPVTPSLALMPDRGYSLSAWVRIDDEQPVATIAEQSGVDGSSLALGVEGTQLFLRARDGSGALVGEVITEDGDLFPGSWSHIALIVGGGEMNLIRDGAVVGTAEYPLGELGQQLVIGARADGSAPLTGMVDELQVSNVARGASWTQAAARSQGIGDVMIQYRADASREEGGGGGEPNYFLITLNNVTHDGWVVIIICAIMALFSWFVMVLKGLTIRSVRKDNARFIKEFHDLGAGDPSALDQEDEELSDSPMLEAFGKHDHYQSSSLYRLYHLGLKEVRLRTAGGTVGAARAMTISPEAINAVRATLDAQLIREQQRLNSLMVFLTLAIAGGPFLGLLGTVIGVMITFAAIAHSGNVDVNSIAPGIAAALAATVAGLVVAIPALFGYNYLATRIKEITADMRVFLDEFVTRIAEHYS